MGWLRDRMSASEPKIRSFGALARGTLASHAWGDAPRPQSRSLAALYSKLDRGVELEWLLERPNVQLALADALGCPVSEVRTALEAELPEQAQTRGRLRLDDLRYGRTVALEVERPCPGIPPEVLDPSRYDRSWWCAAPGAGKTFAGRWLDARGLAGYVKVRSARDTATVLAARRPTFVELEDPTQALALASGRRSLCVAAPFAPEDPSRWALVYSPPIVDYVDDLIDWVAERLPDDGHFDSERARRWFRERALASKIVDSLGIAIGLCGAIDEEGFGSGNGIGPRELVSRAFTRRANELLERDAPDAPWMRRNGLDVLFGIGRRLLTDASETWSSARSLESWLALVPTEYQREVDVDWLRVTLNDGETAFRDIDVQRAARRLPPGAYRIVRALRAARLLQEVAPGQFALRPLWMARIVVEEAKRELVHGSPFEYGEGLLTPHSAAGIAEELLARILREETGPLEEVTELDAESNPAHVAALEAISSCAGLALLAGHELDPEPLEALWQEQTRLLFRCGDAQPVRRIAHRAPPGTPLHDTVWRLAMLAITERLDDPGTDPWFAPWRLSSPPSELLDFLDTVHDELPVFAPHLAYDVYALVDRLRQTLGELRDPPHPLERPAALLDAALLGVLEWDLVVGLGEVPWGAAAAMNLSQRRRQSWSPVATAIWEVWASSSAPASGIPWLDPTAGVETELWPHLPPEVLTSSALARLDIVNAERIGEERLAILIERGERLPVAAHGSLWETLPERWFARALARIPPQDEETARRVWTRFEADVPNHIADASNLGPLLDGAPSRATSILVEKLAAVPRDAISDTTLDTLRRWLWTRVADRTAGFAEAYDLLAEIERELSHAAVEP